MSTEETDFESVIVGLARDLVEEYGGTFAELGLRPDPPEVTRMAAGSRDSELVLYVWDGKNVFDAVEFFLLQEGVPVGTREEVEDWLRKTFDDVVRRRREALGLKN